MLKNLRRGSRCIARIGRYRGNTKRAGTAAPALLGYR